MPEEERLTEAVATLANGRLDVSGPFEAQCLRFSETPRIAQTVSSEQVRPPLYTEGLEHWRSFEPWLGPLRKPSEIWQTTILGGSARSGIWRLRTRLTDASRTRGRQLPQSNSRCISSGLWLSMNHHNAPEGIGVTCCMWIEE